MQVLLRENVSNLGNRGEVVAVRGGYARNYLLPRGIAVEVKRDDLVSIEAEKKRLDKIATLERTEAETLAERLTESSVTITTSASEEGHLFGSVGPAEIAEALSAEVAQVEPAQVRLESHIKELGVYDVTIHVSGDIEVLTKVWVVGE